MRTKNSSGNSNQTAKVEKETLPGDFAKLHSARGGGKV